ncbi:MAG TPA: acyl-ACP--UDP-N-acetylglucosamine O-acyltransferase [Tepidisphaeraceae bacterium]|jgi:UDP-N-acetylglucosamine acyltransferase
MPKISQQSVVDPRAELASDVEVGPFCVVGPDVRIGPGCRLIAHVMLTGRTTVGSGNVFHPNCVIGGPPQDLKYKGEANSSLVIGDDNQIREAVTLHAGTEKGGGITRIGSNNLLMVNAHVGHDAHVGNGCVLANNVMLAGHVVVGDNVVLSGGAASHHFVRISDYVFVAGYSRIKKDVPPFVKVQDDTVWDTNSMGLRRNGFLEGDIEAIEDAVRRLFISKKKTFAEAIAEFDTMNGINPHVKRLVEFLRERDLGKNGRYLERARRK